jgi:hypothetical protein
VNITLSTTTDICLVAITIVLWLMFLFGIDVL